MTSACDDTELGSEAEATSPAVEIDPNVTHIIYKGFIRHL